MFVPLAKNHIRRRALEAKITAGERGELQLGYQRLREGAEVAHGGGAVLRAGGEVCGFVFWVPFRTTKKGVKQGLKQDHLANWLVGINPQ